MKYNITITMDSDIAMTPREWDQVRECLEDWGYDNLEYSQSCNDPLASPYTQIKIGDKVQTPRFLTVRIAAIFENVELAEACGFTTGTDFRDEDYHIRGKHIGENRMLFAAAKRN